MSRLNILPSLPDVCLRRIFDYLTYKDLCQIELVCRRWQNLIRLKQKKEVQELIIEQLGHCQITILEQPSLKRFTVNCPYNAVDFLSGLIKRVQLSVTKMTADLRFFSNIDKLPFKKEPNRKFFSALEDLWMVVILCSDEVIESFMSVEKELFLKITHLTLQVHVTKGQYENVSRLLSALQKSHSNLEINLELHAPSSNLITSQLNEFYSLNLKKIKIICTDLEQAPLAIDPVASILDRNKIYFESIVFREWYLSTDGVTPLARHPLEMLRINSCMIANTNQFVAMIRQTFLQRYSYAVSNGKNLGKHPFIENIELSGSCVFSDLTFLENKAHCEFEYRAKTNVPDLNIDCSHIYYYY